MAYDQSVAPREGTSAISAATRQRMYGGGRRATRGYAPYQRELQEEEGAGGYGFNPQAGGGYNQEALMEMLRAMAERWRPPETTSEELAGFQAARDPVGWANKQADVSRINRWADPWGEGGAFEGRRAADVMTPEQILASQGNTAANQWAQLGSNAGAQKTANANALYGRMWRGGAPTRGV